MDDDQTCPEQVLLVLMERAFRGPTHEGVRTLDWQPQLKRVLRCVRENDPLFVSMSERIGELENELVAGVHTCSPTCRKTPRCAELADLREENERLRTTNKNARDAIQAGIAINVELQAEVERLRAQVDALQAKVDALMLEFCPDEMSEEQKETWARHQRPAPGANLRLGGPMNETPEQTLARLQVAEEVARADAAKNHHMPCVPWRGRDGALGACIYCGKMPDAKGDHDGR